MSTPTCWLDVEITAMTDRAIRVYDGKRHAWIPRSQIVDYEDELERGAAIKIELPEWLALDKELI